MPLPAASGADPTRRAWRGTGRACCWLGGPGAGKSSLAWACARAGLTYVSDDATWLLRSELRVIGKNQRMRFRPDAVVLIPELAELPGPRRSSESILLRSGRRDVPGLVSARGAVLEGRCPQPEIRGAGRALAVGREEARERISEATTLYEARAWQEQEAARRRLVEGGALEAALQPAGRGGAAYRGADVIPRVPGPVRRSCGCCGSGRGRGGFAFVARVGAGAGVCRPKPVDLAAARAVDRGRRLATGSRGDPTPARSEPGG